MHIDVETTTTTTISKTLEPILEPHIIEPIPEPQIVEQGAEPQQETPLPNLGIKDPDLLRIITQGRKRLENRISSNTTQTQHQPLTLDEIVIPSYLIPHILDTLTKNSIDVEKPENFIHSHLISRSEFNQIQIITHNRPKLEPKLVSLPYKKPYQFFKNSEPDLELLTNAFHKSLKSLMYIEEDALIFPSEIAAESGALKAKIFMMLLILSACICKRRLREEAWLF
jgi:hypothetical protein